MRFRRKRNLILINSLILIVFFANFGKFSSLALGANSAPMEGIEILYLVDNDFDDIEYFASSELLESLGCGTSITASTATVTSGNNVVFNADLLISEVVIEEYDCVFVAGGRGIFNLVVNSEAIKLVQDANALNICLAGICGGPLVFAVADIVDGKNVTGDASIATDLTNAGGNYSNEMYIVDGNLVTATYPYTFACCLGILQVLGFYEEDPPEVESIDYTITTSDETCDCFFECEFSDALGIDKATIYAYKKPTEGTTKTLFTQKQLNDDDLDGIFNCTISGFDKNIYEFTLIVTDKIKNQYVNDSILTIDFTQTNSAGIGIGTISSLCIIIFIPILLLKKTKK